MQIRLTIYAAILVLFGLLSYFGYNHIKQIGYEEAEVKYTKLLEEHNKAIAAKISELEKSSRALVAVTESNNTKLTQNIDQIVLGLYGKTLTVIKDDKCIPTKEFSDSFGKLNSSVNESMRGSSK